jgi:hypothetical protein
MLRVTQVKHLQNFSANSGVPIFETNDSQSLMKRITNDCGFSGTASGSEILRSFQWRQGEAYPLADVSLFCRIVSWRLTQDSVDGYLGFEIHAVDSRRSTVLLQFPLPSCLLHRKSLYPWLQRGASLLLRYVMIKEYDAKHDIIVALRTEHTTFELLSSAFSSKFPGEVDVCALLLRLNAISLAPEEVRMTSLRNGKEYFLVEKRSEEGKERTDEAVTVMESCERRRYSGVDGSLVSAKSGLELTVGRIRYRLDERLETQLRTTLTELSASRSVRGDLLVVNRRSLRQGTFELLKEELVAVDFAEPNPQISE